MMNRKRDNIMSQTTHSRPPSLIGMSTTIEL